MNSQRNIVIDLLRGLAIVIMVILHVAAYYLNIPSIRIIWDYTHFVVPLIIFCSVYVPFTSDKRVNKNYIIHRLKRLLIPYWVYVIVLYFTNSLIGSHKPTLTAFIQGFLLLDFTSRDFNWLVLLFIYLMILVPIVKWSTQKRFMMFILTAVSSIVSILLIFYPAVIPYRLVMWIPYLFYLIIIYYSFRQKYKIYIPVILTTSFILYILLNLVLQHIGHPITLIENEYPPNIYFLAYGTFWTFLFFLLVTQSHHYIPSVMKKLLSYLSRNSYSFYFVHIFILYGLNKLKPLMDLGFMVNVCFVMAITIGILEIKKLMYFCLQKVHLKLAHFLFR